MVALENEYLFYIVVEQSKYNAESYLSFFIFSDFYRFL